MVGIKMFSNILILELLGKFFVIKYLNFDSVPTLTSFVYLNDIYHTHNNYILPKIIKSYLHLIHF